MKQAQWVRGDAVCNAPFFRKVFCAEAGDTAELEICGLGFFRAFLNGERIGDDELVPVYSDYEYRKLEKLNYPIHDTFRYRVYVCRYDVTALLKAGENVLGTALGEGWYGQFRHKGEGEMGYGMPRLWFRLTLTGRTVREVVSDEDMVWKPGFILDNSIYYGEVQDARLLDNSWSTVGYTAEGWQPVTLPEVPEVPMTPMDCPPDRVIRTLQPKVLGTAEGRTVYDVGENITGRLQLRANGQPGSHTICRFGEDLNPDGTVNFRSCAGWMGPQIQTFDLISDGSGRIFSPWFTWQAFRYVDVEGDCTPVAVDVIHTDVKPAASFRCSDENLNWLFDAYMRTQTDNMHAGIPSDCPHRERLGYTGDGQVTADVVMTTHHAQAFYRKWMRDIADGQDPVSGHVQHTVPFQGGGGGPGGWGCAIVEVPWQYYKHYGEADILREYFPAMKKWVGYMQAHSENGLVTSAEPGGWCLGEWCTPEKVEIPDPLVNTYFAIKSLRRMQRMADVLDMPEEQPSLKEAEAAFVKGFMTYFDPETSSFAEGKQGADAFAVDLGLGDEKTFANLCKRYEASGEYDTGIFGTDILTRIFFRKGRSDLALALLAGNKKNTFHTMKEAGATTLWERWDARASHNHPMFGAVTANLLYEIAGLRQEEADAGMNRLVLDPADVPLTYAKGRLETATGAAEVLWQRTEAGRVFKLEVSGAMQVTYREKTMTAGSYGWTEA